MENNSSDGKVRGYAADMLIRQFLSDSTELDLGLARTWLQNKGGLRSHFTIVDTWLQEGQPDSAEQAINNIPMQFLLSGEDSIEYLHFDTLKAIEIDAMRNDRTVEQMVAGNLTALTAVANAEAYHASAEASGLINQVNGLTYGPEVTLPYINGQLGLMAPPPGIGTAIQSTASLTALPNPARERAILRYSLPEGASTANITVSGMDGRACAAFKVADGNGAVEWDLRAIENGVYLVCLTQAGAAPITVRFVVAK